jgi:hypothetical protein
MDVIIFCAFVIAVICGCFGYALGYAHGRLEAKEQSNG